ncbi:MAG TPA: type IV pilus assembly protein PilM [Candidatus Limnocylindrales bacterium]|nr:type IV pilus assembly protein PilM [Candidatus Limnocylindrales bacterium]
MKTITQTNQSSYFYKDKPVFGMDIGFSSIKVMQIDQQNKHHKVTGYGVAGFDPGIVKEGIITDPEAIAKAAYDLFSKHLIGDITTRRVALAVPAARTFTRTVTLPKLGNKDLADAVRLETEQYVPVPLEDLYLDYGVINTTEKEMELLSVAIPKKIVDSYLTLTSLLGLETVALETTIGAASRLFLQAEQSDVPTVLIDLGSLSSDITIFDKGLVVTGTVPGGGDIFTQSIMSKLHVTRDEAHVIKTKYGLGLSKKQKEITEGMAPILDQMIKEIKRMMRYYEERSGSDRKIGQVVTMGGGANMPGLSEHMTNLLRLPVRMCDPWQHMDFHGLQPPNTVEKSMYVTVCGLALMKPQEIFA